MKTILALFLALGISFAAAAKENITIYYAWGPGDSVANYSRTLAAEANKIQKKYTFIFDTKPGAGGAIASNHVLNNPNSILAHSTAFFVRPNFYPNESYNLDDFKSLMTQCQSSMAVVASKYQTWNDVPKNQRITVGVSGLGVTTHLGAIQLKKKFDNIEVIPFKSTSESLVAMVGGQVDLHIGFISEAETWMKDTSNPILNGKTLHVLGITGTKSFNGYPTLVSQGFPSAFEQMNVGFHLVLPKKFDDKKAEEIRQILQKAVKTKAVQDSFAVDYCTPLETKTQDLPKWYEFHVNHWKKLSAGITIQ